MFRNYPNRETDKIDDPKPQNFVQRHFKWVVGATALVLLGAVVLAFMNWQRGVNAQGYEWQNNARALSQNVQGTLSTCLQNTRFGAQVAERERQTIIDGMTAIVAARVKNHQEAIPGDVTVFVNAVTEAYPSISPDLYKQLLTIAVGCQKEVNGVQGNMQSYAAKFLTWTKEGNFFEGMIREQFPTAELTVEGPNGQLTGKAALAWMATPIITKDAGDASKTRVMPTENPFPTGSPTKK